jgi:hypothetical protein
MSDDQGKENDFDLWTNPLPNVVRTTRLNPTLVPYLRVFQDGDELVNLADIFEAKKRHTTPQLKRCVRAVAKENDGDVSKAFAICTKQLQRSGYLKQGTNEPTKKGVKAGKSKAAEKGHGEKVKEYETLLAAARKDREGNAE